MKSHPVSCRPWLPGILLLALALPAHAEGAPVFVWPALALMLTHLYPALDLARRRAWGCVSLYLFTQPVIWGLCGSLAFVVSVFAGDGQEGDLFGPGVSTGLAALALIPFLYWRMLLRWLDLGRDD